MSLPRACLIVGMHCCVSAPLTPPSSGYSTLRSAGGYTDNNNFEPPFMYNMGHVRCEVSLVERGLLAHYKPYANTKMNEKCAGTYILCVMFGK